jgi:hypothetical protein
MRGLAGGVFLLALAPQIYCLLTQFGGGFGAGKPLFDLELVYRMRLEDTLSAAGANKLLI